jgi:hypothetical protein
MRIRIGRYRRGAAQCINPNEGDKPEFGKIDA